MRSLLFILFPLYCFTAGKVFDCFLFYNELEILELRLNELDPYVDFFVLAEAEETFRGNKKPMIFHENRKRFSKFLPKIKYVPIRGHIEAEKPFDREQMQRDHLAYGIMDANENDIILLSDVDEIPRGPSIRRMALPVLKRKAEYLGAVMTEYQFFMNRFTRYFLGTMLTTRHFMNTHTFAQLRALRPHTRQINNAGWHFTSLGGLDRYIEKLAAYSLVERDTPEERHPEHFKALVNKGPFVDIDETFPQFVQDNTAYYRSIGFIKE